MNPAIVQRIASQNAAARAAAIARKARFGGLAATAVHTLGFWGWPMAIIAVPAVMVWHVTHGKKKW